jgi:hypothetical protein
MKGDTLKSGTFDIAAIGGTGTASTNGTEQFGLCTYQRLGTGMTVTAPYNDAACSGTTQTSGPIGTGTPGGDNGALFAFDTNNTTGTTSTYGMEIATKQPGDFSSGELVFIGNVANTTEAGIYTTVLTFIATGTY